MRLGERINIERKKKSMSSETLAKACGVSRSYITLIENGKRLPSAKVLPKIAAALDIKTNVILNWYLEDVREKFKENLDS